jgi:N-acetylglucosaminyl-diphospho-decaprenol L-rhamnosyltransferase
MDRPPSTAAIVVTHLGGARLERCLASLRVQRPAPVQVIVVVSNPREIPLPADVEVLRPGRALHYGEAVNLGARAASADTLLVLNDDTVLRPGFLASLASAAGAHPDDLLQPRILLAGDPSRLDNVGHGLFPDGHNQPRGRARRDGSGWSEPGLVGAVSGAAFLAPRARFEALGGFDAELGPYGDDLDLSLRWVRSGASLRYVPDAVVEHELGASYGRASRRKIYLVERNRVRAALRSMPVISLVGAPAWTVARWGLMACAAAAGRGWGGQLPAGAGLAAVAGALVGLGHLPGAARKRSRDAPCWRRGELRMLAHTLRQRARLRDFL